MYRRKKLTLINVYGPNKDSPDFYKKLLNKLSTCDNPVVMAGDFNLVLNQEMNTYNYTSLNNPRPRNVVLDMIIQNSLIDVWREMNVEKREYTWFRRKPIKKARLDYFLIAESLFAEVDESCIYPGYRTDYSMIMMQLQLGKFQKGRYYGKMNNSLLKDHQYVTEIKSIILEVKSRYGVNSQNPNVVKRNRNFRETTRYTFRGI